MGGSISLQKNQREHPSAEATIEATAQGIASLLCSHGPEVEWRICTIWEAAYDLIPLSSLAVDLPEIIVATPLQPPILSWNMYIPLLKVLEYLPRGSPSEAYLMKIFVTSVEAILQITFPPESSREEDRKTIYSFGSASKNLAVAELRTMVHSLFPESCASVELASRPSVAAFDSYVLAAVCALSCEIQLFPLISRVWNKAGSNGINDVVKAVKGDEPRSDFRNSIESAVCHTRRILSILQEQ